MRPFVLCSTLLSLFFAAASVVADQTETIGNQDKRIAYTDGWIPFPSPSGHGGTLTVTTTNSDTATLNVNDATRIAVTVFVEVPGQTVRISLDNQSYDIVPTVTQQPAWTSDILDPSVPHTIQVIKQNPRGNYTILDSFLVTSSSPNTTGAILRAPNQSTSASAIKAIMAQSDGQSGLTMNTKVGVAIAVVGVCLGLLGALWIHLRRKGKNHDSIPNPFSRVVIPLSQSSDAPYASSAGTGGVSPFMGRGSVETQPDVSRKNGGSYGGTNPAHERRVIEPPSSLSSGHSAPPAYFP